MCNCFPINFLTIYIIYINIFGVFFENSRFIGNIFVNKGIFSGEKQKIDIYILKIYII
jgi:hypothetical protein